MTAYNIIKSLTKRGNSIIGSGCYAAALHSNVSYDQVIKIGNNMNDPWLAYYQVIMANQNNPFVPKIYSLYVDEEHSYYVCIMERLESFVTTAEISTIKLCRDYAVGGLSEKSFIKEISLYKKQVPDTQALVSLLSTISNLTTDESGYRLDLHQGNFLFRDGVLVVTDPWCENDMSEIDDVNDWTVRHNLS